MADIAPTTKLIVSKESPTLQEPPTTFQSKASFIQRFIEVSIALDPNQSVGQPNTFTGTDSSNVTLSGFRISTHIEWVGGRSSSRASLKIFGMNPDKMNQLSVLGMKFNSIQQNSITISAGDVSGMTPIFGGTIWSAMANYNAAPNVPFEMECSAGYYTGIVPVVASSFPQSTDVATMMSGFARQMGLAFENNGVSKQLPAGTYFSGSLNDQIERCKKAANINAQIVDAGTKLSIWPMGGSRTNISGNSNTVPLISSTTGMIGYPRLSPTGYMIVRSIYNPQVAQGGQVQVQSSTIPQANRTWVVQKVDLDLESLVPKGKWEMTLYCYPLGLSAPPPPAGTP